MSLNKYLTKLQDAYFITKAQITRSRNFSKKFHKRRELKVKKEIIDNLMDSGLGEFEALFEMEKTND